MYDLKLTRDALLECEMANARGGHDWLKALEKYGNALLHDADQARRMVLDQQREEFQAAMRETERRADELYNQWRRRATSGVGDEC